jgi:hypothetical protein
MLNIWTLKAGMATRIVKTFRVGVGNEFVDWSMLHFTELPLVLIGGLQD